MTPVTMCNPPSEIDPVTGSFSAPGQFSAAFPQIAGRPFNIWVWNAVGSSVQLKASFDGVNWHPLTTSANGTAVVMGIFSGNVRETWEENEVGVLYRLECLSGTANYRISQ